MYTKDGVEYVYEMAMIRSRVRKYIKCKEHTFFQKLLMKSKKRSERYRKEVLCETNYLISDVVDIVIGFNDREELTKKLKKLYKSSIFESIDEKGIFIELENILFSINHKTNNGLYGGVRMVRYCNDQLRISLEATDI